MKISSENRGIVFFDPSNSDIGHKALCPISLMLKPRD
eukprot:COSAG02_NODE_1611_length_11677_cov_2.985662_7_plen_37_part_00